MSNWTIVQDHHATNAIECFEHGGIPVVVRRTGTYAEATDGQISTRDCPHIEINIGAGYPTQGGGWNSTSFILAVGSRGEDGRSRPLRVPFAPTPRASEAQQLVEAKKLLDQAVGTVRVLDAAYAAANARCAGLQQYRGQPMSRGAYVATCTAMGVSPLSDSDCQSYGVRHGNYSFPEYEPDHIILMLISHSRMIALDEEAEAVKALRPATVRKVPQKQGQLWEPCQCGREPIYMPLHLCATCWPQA